MNQTYSVFIYYATQKSVCLYLLTSPVVLYLTNSGPGHQISVLFALLLRFRSVLKMI